MKTAALAAVVLICALMLAALPASANDLADWVQSPGSETLSIGEGIVDFAKDTLTAPDGGGIGFLTGGNTDAWYMHASKGLEWTTGIPQIPKLKAAGVLGLTVYTTDPAAANVQIVGGVGASIVNIRGIELRVGTRFCSSDLGDKTLDLGPLGRVHYQWPAVELVKAL